MIISDLTYLETVEDTKKVEGGLNIGAQFATHSANLSALTMANVAGAGGAANQSTALTSLIQSASGQLIALGL
ncbi:hypothetical protein [Calothrix sp. NIES-3974]|uniref:hypothetical protein n=1 Tax=Calothrix sp. NIES-3974 TaxID=2005462 RepID=UPI000B5FA722|nr:hypothetical protein [Calothrix sp. NIES-3974]BAZ05828.1 hypothetical protein NIES3974_24830 [Calothrix sp. NIES-3974]